MEVTVFKRLWSAIKKLREKKNIRLEAGVTHKNHKIPMSWHVNWEVHKEQDQSSSLSWNSIYQLCWPAACLLWRLSCLFLCLLKWGLSQITVSSFQTSCVSFLSLWALLLVAKNWFCMKMQWDTQWQRGNILIIYWRCSCNTKNETVNAAKMIILCFPFSQHLYDQIIWLFVLSSSWWYLIVAGKRLNTLRPDRHLY